MPGPNSRHLNQAGALATNAVANTENVVVLLAAPGAGVRYRVYGWSIVKTSLAAAPLAASWRGRLGGAAPFDRGHLSMSGTKHADWMEFGDDGIPLIGNGALSLAHLSDIANLQILWAVIYSIESGN